MRSEKGEIIVSMLKELKSMANFKNYYYYSSLGSDYKVRVVCVLSE